MELTSSSTASPRWRSSLAVDDLTAESRRPSNHSSTSSDILVAGMALAQIPLPPSHGYPQHTTTAKSSLAPTPAKATVVGGRIFRVTFGDYAAKEKFRAIAATTPRPQPQTSTATTSTDDESDDEGETDVDGEDGEHEGEAETDGLDPLKTYSKEETLRHPGVEFVHRGQGRYRMAAAIKNLSPAIVQRPTRQVAERDAAAISEKVKDQMFKELVHHFNGHRKKINPLCKPNWSPSQKHQFNNIMKVLRETPAEEWSTVPQLINNDHNNAEMVQGWVAAMERAFSVNLSGGSGVFESRARRARQAATLADVDHRRSSRARVQNTNVFDSDEELAYDNDDNDDDEMETSDSEGHQLEEVGTVHEDELHKYPGRAFHHKGNRFYRPGLAPDGKRGSIVIMPNGEKRKWDEYAADAEEGAVSKNGDADEDDDDDDDAPTYGKVYVTSHPEIEFVHRGKGRYKRKDDVEAYEAKRKKRKLAGSATPTATSDRRASRADNSLVKDYAESHGRDELFKSGRAKRNSKPKIEAIETEDHDRHRRQTGVGQGKQGQGQGQGQGRRASTQNTAQRAVSSVEKHSGADDTLVDSAYVEAHPNETFHHRGQGKWARGLPPPGSSNKTAVRGPDKDKPWQTQGDRIGIDVDADGNRPPPPTALVLKVDGPDKWPNLTWHYRGGGKWWRVPKEGVQQAATAVPRKPPMGRGRTDGPEAQLHRETPAAEKKVITGGTRWKGKGPAAVHLQRSTKMVRKRSQRSGFGDAASSHSQSKAPTPRPALLPPEEDVLTELDLPDLLKDDWSEDEMDDVASHILRGKYQPIVGPEPFVRALTKHDPAVRSLQNLTRLASNAQWALEQIQKEYLELDKIVAVHPMNGKKERKPVKGGKTTMETVMFEDKKEAALYDYNFDPRKIGYQDPDAQKIVRDEEGRELRRRRNRLGADSTLPNGVNYGDGEMTAKRTVKPVSRFDGVVVVQPPRKRSRLTTGAETPDDSRATTPIAEDAAAAAAAAVEKSRGRWQNHVPKRVQELRGESVPSARSASEDPGAKSPSAGAGAGAGADAGGGGGSARKGRPPGSKNLHKRKDAGIKKGPRKPKMGPGGGPNESVAVVDSELRGFEDDSSPTTPTPPTMLQQLQQQEDLVGGDGGGGGSGGDLVIASDPLVSV